ncbi:MAG: hypothetical protein F6K62_17535 [Sphaerospermopsis sp. SIO1G2]|nr:hypothetical protein [Sphaerospermopsis sp. SIO1G2]
MHDQSTSQDADHIGEIDQQSWSMVLAMPSEDQAELLVDFIQQLERILLLHQREDLASDILRHDAHLVKGGARSIGLFSLADALQVLEFAGDDQSKRDEGWSLLLSTVNATKTFLHQHITNLGNDATAS